MSEPNGPTSPEPSGQSNPYSPSGSGDAGPGSSSGSSAVSGPDAFGPGASDTQRQPEQGQDGYAQQGGYQPEQGQQGAYPPANEYGQPGAYGQPGDAAPYGQPVPYGQPNPYGQPTPYGAAYQGGYGNVLRPHPQGTTILVLGIVGLLVCFIPGIFAITMGNKALKEIDANPAAYGNRQSVSIGRILGILSVVLQGGVIVVYGIIIIFAAVASSRAG